MAILDGGLAGERGAHPWRLRHAAADRPGWSVTGDDGRDREPEPAAGLVRQVGPEPARDAPGQGGHDDLVELVIGEYCSDGLQRDGTPQISLNGDAHSGK